MLKTHHSLLAQLDDLEAALKEIENTWEPDSEIYQVELQRQVLMNFSYAYFAYFHATPEHPDWSPLWNPVYALQPNPDDIYLYTPIRGDLSYRVSGRRGSSHLLTFTSQQGMSGMVEGRDAIRGHHEIDDDDFTVDASGDIDILFSAERPAGYQGDWAPIDPQATGLFTRFRSYDWYREEDPRLSIECLSDVGPKPRLSVAQIRQQIAEMARFPGRKTRLYFPLQDAVKDAVGFNQFLPQKMDGALAKQVYLPAFFQLAANEALILEVDIPERVRYWNFQLNDPLFNSLDYVYRLSSINGAQARLSSDGRFRAVIALEDPGVPNWLDTAGYLEGGIYGRWYGADAAPVPTLKRVPLTEVREHLPPDTPVVGPEARAHALRRRVSACQRRRRW